MGGLEAFLLGAAGGLAAEFLAVLPYRKMPFKKWPKWASRRSYWLFAVVLIPLGGVLAALLLSERDVTPYLAFHTGLAAPLVLERLAGNAPDFGAGTVS